MEGFFHFLPNALSFWNIAIIVVGTMGGLILGASPGLSPTMAVALLVPFTFYMDPASGLILLGAVYTGTVAGGAISAVLIRIPGAPANIATLLDGNPMAKKGQSQKALYVCFISSFIGGIFGTLVMIGLTPPLAEIALKFGPSEMFWVAMFGVTVMASLAPGSVIKGLLAGLFGLLLSTVGYSPLLGVPRFVFIDALTGGINIVAALIGLFAIPQVFELIETMHVKGEVLKHRPQKGIFWKTFYETIKMVKTQLIGCVVGTIIGIIPGAGGQVAGLVSYDQVRKFSRNPERFGTGIPEGVAASESANNAMVGPSLIPLLTLGVPGSPTAAVLLGGLLINGLFPGPDLFRDHANVAYTFMAGLFLAQIAMFILGSIMSRYSHWVMNVPNVYMAATVTALAVYGTYTIQNSMYDVYVMFGLGTLMYIGQKAGFSAAPVVLGVILGSIAENNYLKGMLIANTGEGPWKYFFTGWINLIVIILCLISIGYSAYGEWRMARMKRS